ncbi:histidinol dehydrogenase [Chengkuizengella axinellae]|uniref:Histidinol dehydrogenase n=1 Tax=Chengkuizengella axinellae TaxID=3064388 RepID=A0ABT9J2I2_9BACL|nr:histidinol dehydrogenase [Chengkuizengella sp. 2205SS18-9]MDP5275816.1 histidinol dehydrogenase [Chengkuizengella sp. 2205SS18-9]
MRILPAKEFAIKREVEYGTVEQNQAVKNIIQTVMKDKDVALIKYTEQFDGVRCSDLKVTAQELDDAHEQVDAEFLTALRKASYNIRNFHEKQKRNSWMDLQEDGSLLGQVVRPLKRVGIYVPGGTAAYPSSVLMNAIPAQVAGVSEIVMVTPPSTNGQEGINPYILAAAKELGIHEVYRVGGAQSIAALAYGTESIRPVDKICGPGNIYVALAKREVYGVVDIDSIAGPTDITIMADEAADAGYVAADLLSQAEHDEMSSAILVTDSENLALQVQNEVEKQLKVLPRKDIASKSISQNSAILTVDHIKEGIEVVNQLAPEHLEVMIEEPMSILGQIENAGAIFLGRYSAEPVGDYFAGPNHILPTNGTARFSSPLNVDDFIKKSSVIYYSKDAILQNGEYIMELARQEGFEGHARSIQIRLEKEGRHDG